jgi:hypothetical protein
MHRNDELRSFPRLVRNAHAASPRSRPRIGGGKTPEWVMKGAAPTDSLGSCHVNRGAPLNQCRVEDPILSFKSPSAPRRRREHSRREPEIREGPPHDLSTGFPRAEAQKSAGARASQRMDLTLSIGEKSRTIPNSRDSRSRAVDRSARRLVRDPLHGTLTPCRDKLWTAGAQAHSEQPLGGTLLLVEDWPERDPET